MQEIFYRMQRQLKGGISMKKFRVHHILCTVLYRGEGYSGTFCDNMTQKVRELKADPEEPLMLVTDPDMICARCPNRTPDDTVWMIKSCKIKRSGAVRTVRIKRKSALFLQGTAAVCRKKD